MKTKTKSLLAAVAAVLLPHLAMAQDWIDVTDQYITNPRFDGNDITTGWEGTSFGAAYPRENAEHYQKDFDTYQSLSGLKPGTYRLSLSAFYRSGDASSDYNHWQNNPADYQIAELYAASSSEDFATPIALAGSAALEQSLGGDTSTVGGGNWWGGGGTTLYVPNNMEAAYYWFEAGYYTNTLEGIVVDKDGILTIGIRKGYTYGSDWVCLDNWKLEYYGQKVNVTGITLDITQMTLQKGETYTLKASILPADATIGAVRWESSDESICRVDAHGNVTALSPGTCQVTARSKDNETITATCTITVMHTEIAEGSLLINEIQSKNVDMFLDPSFNFGGWVELYNTTDKAISVGDFYVSDDPENLKKHRLPMDIGSVPAHGFKNIWFDHNSRYGMAYQQVNDKLDCDGGTLYISDDAGQLLITQTYPAGIGRASWARKNDGGEEWGWTSTPTPAESNAGCAFCTEQLEAPIVDANGQLFDEGDFVSVKVTIPQGTTLRYTTDGTTPTLDNGTTSRDGRFTVSQTSVYRWRLFKDGMLPSAVTTRSFICKDRDYTLPIVSVVTDPENIYGNEYGVDVMGSGNGRSGNGTRQKANFNMDWDRPVSFEYIEQHPKGNSDGYFQQETDFSISGGWSRKQTPRSFKIKAAKRYDLNSLDYKFFENRPYNKNKVLLLRNGGNDDHARDRYKDAAIHEMVRRSGLYCDLQDWNPTHVFINGEYRGMQNMRQPSNKHLGYALYGIDTDEIDAFEMSVDSGYVQMTGTRDKFEEWYELAKDAANPETWEKLCDLVDMDEYCNYMAVQFNLQNWDWPHNNLKGYRERREGAKFHMVLFDVDNVFEQNIGNPFQAFENRKTYTFYPIFEWGDKRLTLEVEHVTIFLNMLQNETFRKKFIDTYCLVNGSVFEPERCAQIVDEMANYIAAPMGLEGYSNNVWNRASVLKNNFSSNRQSTAIEYIRQYGRMGLSGIQPQQVSLSSNIDGGKILVNDMCVPTGKFNGGLFAPITLKAEAPAGYRFTGWQSSGNSLTTKSIFTKASEWKYYEEGSLDDEDWTATDYDDSKWQMGTAPFGYGSNGKPMSQATTQLAKNDANGNRIPTYYMRKEFHLDKNLKDCDNLLINLEVDDSHILYVNGQEVDIYHLWSGAKYNETCQDYGNNNWYEGDNPYTKSVAVPAEYLKAGKNVVAVEVHNCNATSSDIWWEAGMDLQTENHEDANFVSTDAEYEMPENGNLDLKAVFVPEEDKDMLLASGNVPVKINEVSAGNTVNVNDYFKKDDWIELYNNTDEEVDIAGMYLSDKAKTPLKFQIPTDLEGLNTLIPARGHLVVWASKRNIIGSEIHTNFKLANEDGAQVILTAADKTWSDTLTYNIHGGQESYGRYPDGGQNVYHMTQPTIALENQLTMYSQFAYTYIYKGIDKEEEPNAIVGTPTGVAYAEYISANGMRMGSNRQTLRPGIYIVKYHMTDGTTKTRKEVIR